MIQQNRTETEEHCNYSLGLSVGFFRNPDFSHDFTRYIQRRNPTTHYQYAKQSNVWMVVQDIVPEYFNGDLEMCDIVVGEFDTDKQLYRVRGVLLLIQVGVLMCSNIVTIS